jgi:hypothetical protein
MIRRLALTAGFAILGAVAFAPKAHAQAAPVTEMVPFSGEIKSSCQFNPGGGDAKPGLLKPNVDGRTMSTTLGTPGETIIVCYGPTSGGTISVGTPMKGEKTPAGDFTMNASVTSGNGGEATSEDVTSSFEIGIDEETNLTVNMEVTTNEKRLPAGEYSFNVPVTVTPN